MPRDKHGRGAGAASDPSAPATPLPYVKLFILCTILFCDAFSFAQLFPYVAFMIRDEFQLTDDDTEIGYYAGLLSSSYAATTLVSSYAWGAASDRYGRRPCLLAGLVGTLLSTLGFGFSKTFAMAITCRAIHGLLNGNLGIVKTYLAEITDKTNKASAFSKIGVTTGMGRIAGPLVGGLLSQPAIKYPSVFQGTFLDTFPYLAPCLVAGGMTLTGLILGYFYLEETLKRKQKPLASVESGGRNVSSSATSAVPLHAMPAQSTGYATLEEEEEHVPAPVENSESLVTAATETTTSSVDGAGGLLSAAGPADTFSAAAHADNEVSLPQGYPAPARTPSPSALTGSSSSPSAEAALLPPATSEAASETPAGMEASPATSDAALVGHTEEEEIEVAEIAPVEKKPYWKEKKVYTTIIMYGIIAVMGTVEQNVFPLFAVALLGFDSAEIGFTLAAGAVALIVQQLTIYARVVKALGALGTFRISTLLSVILFFSFPFTSMWFTDHTVTRVTLTILVAIRLCVVNMAFTSLMICISNSTPAENLGRVNGLGQTLGSASRTFGPASGAAIFAWSLTNTAFPFDYHLIFILLAGIGGAALAMSYQLDKSINTDYEEDE